MLLAFEVVLFGGLAFMFFCILRNQDAMLRTMREEHAAMLSALAQMEKRVAVLQQLEASLAVNPQAASPRAQEPPARAEETAPGGWGRAVAPAPETASLLDALSMEPPPLSDYGDERPKNGLPDLKL